MHRHTCTIASAEKSHQRCMHNAACVHALQHQQRTSGEHIMHTHAPTHASTRSTRRGEAIHTACMHVPKADYAHARAAAAAPQQACRRPAARNTPPPHAWLACTCSRCSTTPCMAGPCCSQCHPMRGVHSPCSHCSTTPCTARPCCLRHPPTCRCTGCRPCGQSRCGRSDLSRHRRRPGALGAADPGRCRSQGSAALGRRTGRGPPWRAVGRRALLQPCAMVEADAARSLSSCPPAVRLSLNACMLCCSHASCTGTASAVDQAAPLLNCCRRR